ncbi:MAG: restriction endonuclease subunit S [Eisenbergiella sp.]
MAKLIDITGKALSGEWGTDDETGNGIPVLRTTNFTNEGVVNYNDVVTRTITKKNIDDKFLRKGDIIIEKSGGSDKFPVGRVIYFDGEEKTYLFNNFTGLLRVKNQDVWYPRYVFYSLYANYKRGGTRAFENKTTGLHNLKTDDYVSRYEVAEIDKTEQILICEKLDKLYGIVKSRERELQLLNELIKARFIELFGDPKDNPKGYSKKQLKETCRVITGNTPSRAVSEYYGDHIEWIKTDNIVSGLLNPTTATESLSEKGMAVSRTVESGAILMACIAGSIASIGRVCVTDRKVAFNQQINAIVPSDYNILFLYVMLQISKEYLVDEINMALKGILSKSKLEEKTFYVPPMELQEQFAAFVAQTDKSKVTPQKATKNRKNTLKRQLRHYNSTTHHTQGGFPA